MPVYSIADIQKAFAIDFLSFDDDFMKYSYLLECAMSLPLLSDEDKEYARLVEGCVSQVWVGLKKLDEGRAALLLESDTLIVRGVLAILKEMLIEQSAEAVEVFEFTLVKDAELEGLFSSQRQVGFQSIVAMIKELIRDYAKECEDAGTPFKGVV